MAASGTRGSIGKASYEAVRKHIDEGKKATEAFRLVAQETGRSTATVQTAYYRVARSLPGGGGVQLRPRKKTARQAGSGEDHDERQGPRAPRAAAQERSRDLLGGRSGTPAERGRRSTRGACDPPRARARRGPQGQRAPGEDRARSRSLGDDVAGWAAADEDLDRPLGARPPGRFPPDRRPVAGRGSRRRGDGARLRADTRAGADRGPRRLGGRERTAGARPAASCAAWPVARRRCGAGHAPGRASISPRPTARTTCRSSRARCASPPSTSSTTSGRRSST